MASLNIWGDVPLTEESGRYPTPPEQSLAAGLVKGMWAPVDYVGRVARGQSAVFDPETGHVGDEAIKWANDQAVNRLPTRIPVQNGEMALGMFGGSLAKTADHAALAKAQELAASGADRKAIWDQTGWFTGADGKWRFEIPDQASFLKGTGSAGEIADKTGNTVGGALFHHDLYSAYPEMKGLQLDGTNLGPKGQYAGGLLTEPAIAISNRLSNDQARSTLLHELQHGVQDAEGFARGGNTYGLSPKTPAWDIYQERLKAIASPLPFEQFVKQAGYEDMAQAAKDYKDYVKQARNPSPMIDRAAQEYAVQEAYRRQAGEVEARNVQKRADMSPDERRATPPWETQDVADNLQIILRKYGIKP
jgi:hypothetical protein